MNKVPYLVAGGVVGGVLGWLITDYLLYKKDEEKYDVFPDEDAETEELVGGMDKELYEFDENADPKKIEYNKPLGIRVTDQKETLEKLTRPYQEESSPYILTAAEWEDTGLNAFERKTILYYEMDSVYCNDQEELVEDPFIFVPNVHLHFGEESDDPDIVYVCNPGRSEMYEILRMRASYQIEVLGEVPVESPKEKDIPKKRANQPGSQKERKKKEVEELGDVD